MFKFVFETPVKFIFSLGTIALFGYAGYYIWDTEHKEWLAIAIWVALTSFVIAASGKVPWKVWVGGLVLALALALIGQSCDQEESAQEQARILLSLLR